MSEVPLYGNSGVREVYRPKVSNVGHLRVW